MLDAAWVRCPYCGERFEAVVDASSGAAEYIEDCPVCCRPISFRMQDDGEGNVSGLEVGRDE